MLNQGKCENGTKLNFENGNYIVMWPNSILTGMISVRNKEGEALYQKDNCTVEDIPFAIEIAKRNLQTGIFETN